MNEGFSSKPYKDQLGYLTIGYGHLILPNEKFLLKKQIYKKALEIKRDDCRKFALKLTWEDCTNQYLSFMIDAKTGEPVVY